MNHAAVEKAIRTGLGIVGRVAPPLGGRLALRLFCTPIARPLSAGARTFMAEAERRDVTWEGGTVATHAVGADGPPVLLVHGWSAHGASLRAFAKAVVAGGGRAVAVDLPAHGASTGRTVNMLEASQALAAVLRDVGPCTGAVCHSFGAPALLLAVERGAEPVPEHLATVGAPMDMDKVFGDFARRFDLPSAAERRMRARVDAIFGRSFLDYDIPAVAARFGDRLLVVHDVDDRDVPHAEGVALAGAAGRLLTTEGLGHNRVLRDPGVVAEVASFVMGRPE